MFLLALEIVYVRESIMSMTVSCKLSDTEVLHWIETFDENRYWYFETYHDFFIFSLNFW